MSSYRLLYKLTSLTSHKKKLIKNKYFIIPTTKHKLSSCRLPYKLNSDSSFRKKKSLTMTISLKPQADNSEFIFADIALQTNFPDPSKQVHKK